MPTAQVRFYETEQQARDAAQKLRESGFSPDSIVLVTPSEGDASPVQCVGVSAQNVPTLSKRVRERGQSLVAVSVPYGRGVVANAVLEEFRPDAKRERLASHMPSGGATPLSDFLGMPVLTKRRLFFGSRD